ncbi:non-heme iron oxygenase ferredoxin subunit [Conexibacter woesei]|uniref:non-heme iron oxygenase ferredoxin subunit n=1 Tax=Conexibacter woesei TaxID=191495 RepID=UPI001917057C|nr:non-heme iron oxygenase ferredoxin subunit [Conexibacter woesei]
MSAPAARRGGRVPLCRVGELAPGEMRRVVREDGPPLAVYNVDGVFHATDDTCTHARASLTEGDLDGCEVVCPVHMGAFDVRSGEPLCFPVTRALRTYEVAVEDGVVWALDSAPARS